ncbi:MAG: DUF2514 family protein [Pseudomonas sp.]
MSARILVAAVVGLLLVGFAIGWGWSGSRWDARYTALERDHATAMASQLTAARERESALRNLIGVMSDETQAENERMAAELAAADAATGGLRKQLAAITTRAAGSAATAAECEAARRTVGMLAELLEQSDHLAGEFAAAADGARVAGRACERIYNAARAAGAD